MRAKDNTTRRKNNTPTYSRLKASLGQAQVLIAILFLFLVPTSVILAQNATLNETLPLEGDLISDMTFQETITLPFEINIDNVTDMPDSGNQTIEINDTPNSTNSTLPPTENIAINDTNTTDPPITDPTNETINDTIDDTGNETDPDEPNITIPIELPMLFLDIDSPERFTRNTTETVETIVTNSGLAPSYNTLLILELPEYFELVSGNLVIECGELSPGDQCKNKIEVNIPADTALSKEEIKVTVSYED